MKTQFNWGRDLQSGDLSLGSFSYCCSFKFCRFQKRQSFQNTCLKYMKDKVMKWLCNNNHITMWTERKTNKQTNERYWKDFSSNFRGNEVCVSLKGCSATCFGISYLTTEINLISTPFEAYLSLMKMQFICRWVVFWFQKTVVKNVQQNWDPYRFPA